MTEPDLHSAFALRSPEEALELYRQWAESYDAGFAREMAYRLPAHVAGAFLAAGGAGPVLDVGAGTGLLAEELRQMGFEGEIDGIDLSPDMLERATHKGLYRRLVQADVTQELPVKEGYAGIVSSGTFTHGHVGPEALGPMLAVAAPGAQFALSINAGVYAAQGFDVALEGMEGIADLQLIEVEVYGPAAAALDAAHAADRAMIALFRKI